VGTGVLASLPVMSSIAIKIGLGLHQWPRKGLLVSPRCGCRLNCNDFPGASLLLGGTGRGS